MGRRRKKQQISTQTAVILAGTAVAIVTLIGVVILIRSSRPMARNFLPPPVLQTPEEAWENLLGTWTHKRRAGNSSTVMTYRFTADRQFIRSSSVTGGVLPKPMTSTTSMPVLDVEVIDDEIDLSLGPGTNELGIVTPAQTITFRFTGPRTIVLVTGDEDDEIEYTRQK
jgi:hypothetical protein